MNSFYVCMLFVGVTLQIAISQNTPAITYISPRQVVDVGGSVELQCSASNAEEIPILWTKTDERTLYISSGWALLIRNSRYSIRQNTTSHTFTLKINDLQFTDSGLYQCALAIARGNLLTADVELEIRTPATAA